MDLLLDHRFASIVFRHPGLASDIGYSSCLILSSTTILYEPDDRHHPKRKMHDASDGEEGNSTVPQPYIGADIIIAIAVIVVGDAGIVCANEGSSDDEEQNPSY